MNKRLNSDIVMSDINTLKILNQAENVDIESNCLSTFVHLFCFFFQYTSKSVTLFLKVRVTENRER